MPFLSSEPIIFLAMACMKVGISTIYQLNYEYFALQNNFNTSSKISGYACDPTQKSQQQIDTQMEANTWGKYCQLIYTFTSLIAFVLTAMSDKYGRKIILVICLIGQFVFYVIHVIQFYYDFSLYWQFLANFINGVTGGTYVLLSVSFAAIADITTSNPQYRPIRISIAELSIGLGSTLLAFFNGYLIKYTDNLLYCLGLVCVLQFIAILYCLCLFGDESQKKSESVLDTLVKGHFGASLALNGFPLFKNFFSPKIVPYKIQVFLLHLQKIPT